MRSLFTFVVAIGATFLLATAAVASANGGTAPEVVTGGSHTCALSDAGRVSCWGANSLGQLGTGDTGPRPSPAPVTGLDGPVLTIAATERGTCAVKQDGTVWCWGGNDAGQLGQGAQDGVAHVAPVQVAALKDIYWLVGGANHYCGASWNAKLYCWGANNDGQVGNGVVGGSVLAPAQVAGVTKVKALAAGANFSCVSGESTKPRCWGANAKGQLGVAPGASTGSPTEVPGVSGVYELQAGAEHVCALGWEKIPVQCWGDNFYGQLAQGTTGEVVPRGPSAVTTLTEPYLLGGTSGSTCSFAKAVVATAKQGDKTKATPHALYCWGEGTDGRLGVGNENHSGTPLPVALGDVAWLSQGSTSRTQCAIVRGGGVFCWGDNSAGQVGLGGGPPSVLIPSVVPGLDLVNRPQYPAWVHMEPRSKLKRSASGKARVIKTQLTIEPSPFVFPADACKGKVRANAYYLKKVKKRKKKRDSKKSVSKAKSGGYEYKKIGVRTKPTKLRRSGSYCKARFVQTLPNSRFARKRPIYVSATFFGNKAMTKFTGGDNEITKRKKKKKSK
ncbi:MAG: RCC1 domain-containing protein [Solirubrobacterales bacterium]